MPPVPCPWRIAYFCGVFTPFKELVFLFSFCFSAFIFVRQENFVFVFFGASCRMRKRPDFSGRNSRGVPIANRGKLRLEPRYHSLNLRWDFWKEDKNGRVNYWDVCGNFLRNIFIGNNLSIAGNESRVKTREDVLRKRRDSWEKSRKKRWTNALSAFSSFWKIFWERKKRKILFFAFFQPNFNASYLNYSPLSDDNTVSRMARAESLLVPRINVSSMKA